VVATPAAIVQQLHADEHVLATASGPAFVAAAQDRERLIHLAGPAVLKLAPGERDDLLAHRDLLRLRAQSPPRKAPLRLGPPTPAPKLVAWYREAQRRFGVRWQLLAAINFVETAFGRARSPSVSGAQGPMQFEPATWRRYGLGGDVHDAHDAILGAANYLASNHARTDERDALFHYNPSSLYVDAVLHYAHRITHVRYAFAEYYAWVIAPRR
jgi:soluble lytic murein transglycosylase-like protein